MPGAVRLFSMPLASGGWLARTDAGALDGSDDAPLHIVTRAGVGETVVAHDVDPIGRPEGPPRSWAHRQALINDFNGDGSAHALPPGSHVLTRYDWTNHRTAVVAVFDGVAVAEAELVRLRAVEIEEHGGGYIHRPHHYALVPRLP